MCTHVLYISHLMTVNTMVIVADYHSIISDEECECMFVPSYFRVYVYMYVIRTI